MPLVNDPQVDAALAEVSSRIDDAPDLAARRAALDEAMTVACEEALDLLDAVGRGSDVGRCSAMFELAERFDALRGLFLTEATALEAAAADAGLGARHAYCHGLLDGLARLGD